MNAVASHARSLLQKKKIHKQVAGYYAAGSYMMNEPRKKLYTPCLSENELLFSI